MALIVGIIAVSLHACQSTSEDDSLKQENPTSISDSDINDDLRSMMETLVVEDPYDSLSGTSARKVSSIGLNNNAITPVIADLEFVEPSKDIDIKSINTYGDMVRMQQVYDIEFYIMKNEPVGREIVIFVSEEKTLEALMPLIKKSKSYLYKKGFTDAEIDAMLAENNVSQAALVPLYLTLSEYEGNNELPQSDFVASTGITRTDPAIEKSLKCAASAFGMDVVAMLIQEAPNLDTRTFTKAAVKLLLKKIAPKVFSFVGAAIFTIDYLNCIMK